MRCHDRRNPSAVLDFRKYGDPSIKQGSNTVLRSFQTCPCGCVLPPWLWSITQKESCEPALHINRFSALWLSVTFLYYYWALVRLNKIYDIGVNDLCFTDLNELTPVVNFTIHQATWTVNSPQAASPSGKRGRGAGLIFGQARGQAKRDKDNSPRQWATRTI